MHSSALDIFTVHSILLDIIFTITITLGFVCIALFQINDCAIYLLGFYSFSVLQPKLQLCPNFWLGHVVEPFMEALDSQHHAGLATVLHPLRLSAGTPAEVTMKEPLMCLSTYGCPTLLLPKCWGSFQCCGADVLLRDVVGGKAIKEDTRSQASKWLWWANATDLL